MSIPLTPSADKNWITARWACLEESMARSLTVISLLLQSTTHCRYQVYIKFLLTYTAIYRGNRKVLPLGITALQPQSHFHLGTPYRISADTVGINEQLVLWLRAGGGCHPGTCLEWLRCRLSLKYDGTRAETRVRLSAKRTSPFKSARASVQSTTGSRGVRISGSNAGYTMFRDSV